MWPVVEENDWTGDVKAFLHTNLSDSYVSRFEDNSGIQLITIKPGADTQRDKEYVYTTWAMLIGFAGLGYAALRLTDRLC
jgi:menaquinone-dependent protoporphyrinogen IX oxidase